MAEEANGSVEVRFELAVGQGRINARVEVPAGRTNLTEILPIIQNLDNAVMRMTTDGAAAQGLTVSCKAGCGACCRQMVPISIFEAQALGQWIATLPPEYQQMLRERFHRTLLSLRDTGIIDRLTEKDWLEDNEAAQELAIAYFRQGLPCPFLEDESCSIHPIRPLSCREYLVTSPAEYCADPALYLVAGLAPPLKLSRILFCMTSELERDGRGWIPLVFLFAWMGSGADPGSAYSGTGPEVLYEVIRRLATKAPAAGAAV